MIRKDLLRIHLLLSLIDHVRLQKSKEQQKFEYRETDQQQKIAVHTHRE